MKTTNLITNTIHNLPFEDNSLPDHCADLIIADPPYYNVKGKFDFVWSSLEAYLVDVRIWATECRRLLSPTGTLVWYGSDWNIAYTQIILDEMFSFLNNCTWLKTNGRNVFFNASEARRFFPNTERFLIYEALPTIAECEGKMVLHAYDRARGMLRTTVFSTLVNYMISERDRAGYTTQSVNRALETYMGKHWFTRDSQWGLPTAAMYGRLRELFNSAGGDYLRREYDDLRREYDDLRREYDDLRRYFRLPNRMTDILAIPQNHSLCSTYDHPTVKSERLTEMLIEITTRTGALVVVPFAGSGTECAAAAKLGRDYVGFEIDDKWATTANRRASEQVQMKRMF